MADRYAPPERPNHATRPAGNKLARPTDDQLLDGAKAVFAAVGFSSANMEAIAEAAGCTKPTLYAHFSSKKQIYQQALERESERLRQWLFAAYDDADGKSVHDQIHRGMAAMFDYVRAEPDGFRLLFATDAEGHARVMDGFIDSVTPRIATMIRDALAAHGQTGNDHRINTVAALLVGNGIFSVRHAYLGQSRPAPHEVLATTVSYAEAALRHISLTEET